jgi:hypothetical protein
MAPNEPIHGCETPEQKAAVSQEHSEGIGKGYYLFILIFLSSFYLQLVHTQAIEVKVKPSP